jgi:hypothetical protein
VRPALCFLLPVGLVASLMTASPSFASDISAAGAAGSAGAPTIRGLLQHADGTPFRAGAPVAVFAIPQDDAPGPPQEGASRTSERVAAGAVSDGGRFAVTIEDAERLRDVASSAGLVDLEVRAVDGTAFAPFALSRRLVQVDGRTTLVDPDQDSPATDTRRSGTPVDDLGADVTTGTVRSTGTVPDAAAAGLPVGGTRSSGGEPRTQVCGETLLKNIGSRRVVVGSTYAMVSGSSGRFVYRAGAATSLGVAYSVNGSKGTWAQAGTTSRASSVEIDFGKRTGGRSYETQFRFGKYAQWCRPVGSTQNQVYDHVVKANRFDGGAWVVSAPTPSATYCRPYASGTDTTRSTTAANVWSHGVRFVGPLGIDLTAKTGYTDKAALNYRINGKTRQICGTSDYWVGTPKRAVVR